MPDQALPATPDLVLERPARKPDNMPDFAAGQAAHDEERRKLVRAAREGLSKASEELAAGAAAADPPPETEAKAREDVASIDLQLDDGRICRLEKKNSLSYRIATLLANDPAAAALEVTVRALMSISDIDGKAPPPLSNRPELVAWMGQLGDDNVQMITSAYLVYWPPLMVSDLRVLKKTLKTPIS